MDKAFAAIVANAAALQFQGSIAQLPGGHSRKTNIYRHGLHMQAVFGHAAGATAQGPIGFRRAIATDNVDLGIGAPNLAGEIVEQIEQPRIKLRYSPIARVAQKIIELFERLRKVSITLAINNVNMFVCVSVI